MLEMPLGQVHSVGIKVKISDKSAVAMLHSLTDHPIIHLLVVGENEDFTWEESRAKEIDHGDLVTLAHRAMPNIIEHFLPHLSVDDAAWRFEVNSDKAASRATLHTHIIMGHKDLFGGKGLIRRCVDTIMKPEMLVERAFRHLGLSITNSMHSFKDFFKS